VVDPFELPEGWPRLGGLDWGYAPHPGVLLLLAFDPHGRAWAYREYVFREEPPEHLAEILAEEVLQDPAEREATIYADNVIWGRERDRGPSIAEVVSRELRRRGCSVRLVPADKARAVGWARVHDYLDPRRAQPDGSQGPWLRVFRRAGGAKSGSTIGCPYLIETLPAQVHDPHRPGDLLKAGREDDTDHAVDALRYALVSRPRLPPLDVQVAGAERRHAAYVHQVLRERLAAAIAARQGGHGRETVSAPDTLATWQDWL
jgi:hypothetical protein